MNNLFTVVNDDDHQVLIPFSQVKLVDIAHYSLDGTEDHYVYTVYFDHPEYSKMVITYSDDILTTSRRLPEQAEVLREFLIGR